jgi:hypothetical protein
LRAVVISQARGTSGTPSTGHRCAATAKCLLGRVLGDVQVAAEPHDRRDDAGPLRPADGGEGLGEPGHDQDRTGHRTRDQRGRDGTGDPVGHDSDVGTEDDTGQHGDTARHAEHLLQRPPSACQHGGELIVARDDFEHPDQFGRKFDVGQTKPRDPVGELPVIHGHLEAPREGDQTEEQQRRQHEDLEDHRSGGLPVADPLETECDQAGRHRAQKDTRSAVGLGDSGRSLGLQVEMLGRQHADPRRFRITDFAQPHEPNRRSGRWNLAHEHLHGRSVSIRHTMCPDPDHTRWHSDGL